MIGRTVSHYRILEKLGEGGMGIVYKAQDMHLKRFAALKFLPPDMTRDAAAKARFIHEARAASALDHPNICAVHDIGEDAEGRMFMVMPYYEGATLKEVLAQGGITEVIPAGGDEEARLGAQGQLPVEDAMGIASQIAKGLAAAHAKGIVHRDIKPANIFVTKDNTVKILDFGIAKLESSKTKLTKTGSTVGTVAYMSPEQALGKEVDQRSDVWSLGVVLYEMLAGEAPFRGDHEQAVVYTVINEEPEPLARIRKGFPSGLAHIVGQALAKNPKDRYQGMPDMLEDLAAVTEGLKPLKAKPRPDQPEKSIAVLPFINDSPDQENTYFINGVMEEILNNLQKIKTLRVISRTSIEPYREKKKPVREIAEELGVNYIVEGSGQKYGTAFRLRAQLIMAANETHLWGDSFQGRITGVEDIFDVQAQIAESVAGALKAVISPEEKQLIEKLPTADLVAYDAFLKGKFAAYKTTPEDLDAAIQYFDQAKARDPRFALAYAGISWVWLIRQQLGMTSPDEAGPQIMDAVGRALELDNTLAEVQFMLANMKVFGMWDWEGGESAYKKALEINPNHAETHGVYSLLLITLGRPEEAMEHIELALKLDPHNPLIRVWHSAALLFVGRYDDCISVGRDVLEKNTSLFLVLDQVSDALHLLGRYEEALAASRLYYDNLYKDFDHVFDQFERLGYAGTLSLEADTLIAQSKSKYVCLIDLAALFIRAENKERALDCLEQAYEKRDSNIVYIGVREVFAILSGEPRFQELLGKLKLPSALTRYNEGEKPTRMGGS